MTPLIWGRSARISRNTWVPLARLVVQIVTDDHDIDGHASDGGQQLLGIRGRSYDLQAAIVAQSVGQELGVDARAVGNYDTDKVRA